MGFLTFVPLDCAWGNLHDRFGPIVIPTENPSDSLPRAESRGRGISLIIDKYYTKYLILIFTPALAGVFVL